MLERTIPFSIEVGKIKNTYQMSFPTVAQLIAIESRKMALTYSQYTLMMRSSAYLAQYALDLVDMVAFLEVLVPDLKKDMKVSIVDLDIMDAQLIMTAFKEQVVPWINGWQNILSGKVDLNEVSNS